MKKFLIIVDMQTDFVDGALGTPEAVAIVDKVCKKIAAYAADPDGILIATMDTHTTDYMNTAEGKHLPVPHCILRTDGWLLDPRVLGALGKASAKDKECTYVNKPTFGSIELPTIVRELAGGEDFSIELCGLCTDICVVSNALILKAHFPEVPISVDASASAGVTVATHNAALDTMAMCQIEIVGR